MHNKFNEPNLSLLAYGFGLDRPPGQPQGPPGGRELNNVQEPDGQVAVCKTV